MTAYEKGTSTSDLYEQMLSALRGFMVYVLVKQLYVFYKVPYPPTMGRLFETRSQAALIDEVNAMFSPISGELYYNKQFATGTSLSLNRSLGPSLAAVGPNAAGAGPAAAGAGAPAVPTGGRRKTRRKRRSLKRRL
jgi:hypothetical protein